MPADTRRSPFLARRSIESLPMIGRRIGNYRIDGEQGRGTMGVAYRATDLRLDRRAILKFLAPELLAQTRARQRFEREARAASALDHPNICTVYQIGEAPMADGKRQVFIAMAFYDGATLAQKLREGPLSAADVATWIEQVASGLHAAHRQGVIHRDIKAANVMITRHGVAKILDFGLAKLQGLPDAVSESIVGTPAYLAPETLRGQEATPASDLFSLASLAFEMLTGRVPFSEFRGPALLNALLHRTPSAPSENPGFRLAAGPERDGIDAQEVDRVILRGLAKEPEDRQADAPVFADELRRALGASAGGEQSSDDSTFAGRVTAPRSPSRGSRLSPWRIAGLWAVAAIFGFWAWKSFLSPPPHPRIARTVPLTRAQGLEKSPSFSPDGEQLAFASDQLGNMDIWLRQTASNQSVPLTADHEGYDDFPVFSPDGQWIAFVSDRQGGGIFLMSALGGPPRRVFAISFVASQESPIWVPTLAFSPDGKRLAVSELLDLGGPWIVDLATGDAQTVVKPPALSVPLTQPAFAPDGNSLVMAAIGGAGTSVSTLWQLNLSTGESRPLTSGRHLDQYPLFSADGKLLYFLSNRAGSQDLWFMSAPNASRNAPLMDPMPLTTGVGLGFPTLSKDGRKLAYSQIMESSNLWTMELGDQAKDLDGARQLTHENHVIEFVDPSSDGKWLAFDSNRNGNVDLWLMPREGGEPRQLTTDPAHDFCPRFSPDDREIAFYSLRSGNRDLWVLNRRDGSLRPLAPHPERDWMPQWSPDGRWIYFESSRSGNHDLWRVDAAGQGEPEQLTFHSAPDTYPVISPDGNSLAFSSSRTGSFEVHVLNLQDRHLRRLTRLGSFTGLMMYSWSEDGTQIYGQAREASLRAPNIWAFHVADGSARPVTNFRSHRRRLFETVSVQNQTAFFPIRERQGDLWLAELAFE